MKECYNFTHYEVGERHPRLSAEDLISLKNSNRLELESNGELTLYCCINKPHPIELEAFKNLHAIGLYRTPGFEQGLWIWQFNRKFIQETPFNPTVYRDNRVEMIGKVNMMLRFLLDEDGIIRSISVYGLYYDFLNHAKSIWTNPGIAWGDYSERLANLYSIYTTQELWNRVSHKWISKQQTHR
jgi:hypothetical protein